MNEFYNKAFLKLIEELQKEYNSSYYPRMLEYENMNNKETQTEEDIEFNELKKHPIDDEFIKIKIDERYKKLSYSATTSLEDEKTEKQKEYERKIKFARSFIRNEIKNDVLFDEFYNKYRSKCNEEELEEKYIMSRLEFKEELRVVGIGVNIIYNTDDEPEEYITMRFFNIN